MINDWVDAAWLLHQGVVGTYTRYICYAPRIGGHRYIAWHHDLQRLQPSLSLDSIHGAQKPLEARQATLQSCRNFGVGRSSLAAKHKRVHNLV